MKRAIRWYDYITVNIYFFGLTTLAQTCGLVFPLLIQQFVGETQKATYFGTLRLWTLMMALLVQAFMGMLSDRSKLRWGRRRPFIFLGTLLDLVFITAIGALASASGLTGYILLFVFAMLLQFSSNMAHGAEQGLIPDLVPEQQRGRFSAVKTLLEVPIPLILVALTIGKLISAGNMWGALLAAMAILVAAMLLTMLVPENRLEEELPPIDWQPFLRLVVMTGAFTLVILGVGQVVQWLGSFLKSLPGLELKVISMGLVGLLGMALSVALGVILSVRISVGETGGRNRAFTWWVVNRLAFLVAMVNLSSFAVYYMQARLGYSGTTAAGPASNLMMFVGGFILVSALPSGWLADRLGRKTLVGLGGIIAAFGTLVVLLTTNMNVIYLGGALIGLAAGLFYVSNWALGTDIVPKQEAGRYLGLSNLAGAGAGAIGSYIGGPIADFFTASVPEFPGLGYVLLFAIYLGLFLLSTLALSQVKIQK